MMHDEPDGRVSRGSYLIPGAALILGLLVGLGVGVMVAGADGAETEIRLPAAVREFHADWYAAWNEGNGDAVMSMMAPGGRHYCPGTGADGAGGQELAEFVATGLVLSDIEVLGAIAVDTPGDASGLSQDHVVVTELTVDGHPGYVAVLHLRGSDDQLRVVSHRAFP